MRGEMTMNTKVKWTTIALTITLALALVMTSGCAKKKKGEPVVEPTDTSVTDQSAGGSEGLPGLDENTLFSPDRGLQFVYFDYDSYALRPDALAMLKDNADKIGQVAGVMIQIEGHCDERGTQEYNFALGERRALAVREHLMKLGVPGDRMVTISYGEEDPQDPGHDESAWAKNRRCEFNKAAAK